MARRRGNPNWGKAIVGDLPIVPSKFELLVKELGIADTPEKWAGSGKLRDWAAKNRHFRFVPERLLAEWKLVVDADL